MQIYRLESSDLLVFSRGFLAPGNDRWCAAYPCVSQLSISMSNHCSRAACIADIRHDGDYYNHLKAVEDLLVLLYLDCTSLISSIQEFKKLIFVFMYELSDTMPVHVINISDLIGNNITIYLERDLLNYNCKTNIFQPKYHKADILNPSRRPSSKSPPTNRRSCLDKLCSSLFFV